MSKLGKSCVLRITPTHMFFIVKEPQSITCSPVIWCTIEEGHFFSQYEMEGFSQIDNEILMEFVTGMQKCIPYAIVSMITIWFSA